MTAVSAEHADRTATAGRVDASGDADPAARPAAAAPSR